VVDRCAPAYDPAWEEIADDGLLARPRPLFGKIPIGTLRSTRPACARAPAVIEMRLTARSGGAGSEFRGDSVT